ncbi:hypothetical protein GCM10010336_62960 [Streptomyces goshikiensis]|nr:hypothetical protein GCM10010336_62960 [Streptomyces goshikiensis]
MARRGALPRPSQTLGSGVGVQDLKLSGLLHYRSERGTGRLSAVFAKQRWSGEPRNTVPRECSEVVWADPSGPPADCLGKTSTARFRGVGYLSADRSPAQVLVPGSGP